MSKSVDIVGIGCSSVDFFAVAPRYPERDTKTEMREFAMQGGGLVGTALAAAARLGAACRYLARVGDDALSRLMVDGLAAEGVDTSRVGVEPGGAAFVAICIVDASEGSRTIFWSGDRAPELRPEHLRREDVTTASFLHVDGFDMDAALLACRWMRDAGGVSVVDAEVHHERMAELMDACDVIIPSEEFACTVTGESDYRDAARALYDQQARVRPGKAVIVTAGARGCFAVTPQGEFHQPAFKVDVVDTTGCGDVFHGAFIYARLQGWDWRTSARFAAAVAALKTRRLGGRAGIPTRAEVDAFLAGDPPLLL